MAVLISFCLAFAFYLWHHIAEIDNIAKKNLRNFTILSLIPASAHIVETANIAEIASAFEVLFQITSSAS